MSNARHNGFVSFEQFAHALAQFRETGAWKRHDESRRSLRINLHGSIVISPCRQSGCPAGDAGVESPGRFVCQLKDMSPRGVCLISPTALERGQNFIMELGRDAQPPARILFAIVYCKSLSSDSYSIGAEFVCALEGSPERADSPDVDRIRQLILS